ncbi:hypothetical protein BDZ91DRAFT_850990 [Kalaharituber pfeilii]|nr:hypothetical protein BDZ91DRAFT_850990 [Kalaharituber pfeilii]
MERYACSVPNCLCPGSAFAATVVQRADGHTAIDIKPCGTCGHGYTVHAQEPANAHHQQLAQGESATRVAERSLTAHAATAHLPEPSRQQQHRHITPPRATATLRKAPRSPPVRPGERICPRAETVAALLACVLRNKVVLVQGAPASGKTTLLGLLYYHIRDVHGDRFPVFRVNCWNKRPRPGESTPSWRNYILEQTDEELDVATPPGPYALLIDEAQMSYWDTQFWVEYIKETAQGPPDVGSDAHVVLFSSYGSAAAGGYPESHEATPPFLAPGQTVGFVPNLKDDGWGPPVGLLFTKTEFEDAFNRSNTGRLPPIKPGPNAIDCLFQVTQGHPGAFHSLLDSLYLFPPSRKLIQSGHPVSAAFLNDVYFPSFTTSFKYLANTPFCRGLPQTDDLALPERAAVLEYILVHRSLPASVASIWPPERQEALTKCHRAGWIHLHRDPETQPSRTSTSNYVLASPLHQWYLNLLLLPPSIIDPVDKIDGFANAFDLCCAAVRKFRPRALRHAALTTTPTTGAASSSIVPSLGPAARPRPREAIFQDEFYRATSSLLPRALIAVPECGDVGRIDFFVPHVRWGIEIARFSQDLDEHVDKFSSGGSYAAWGLREWVLLNFTNKVPKRQRENAGIIADGGLYHVLMTENYTMIEVVRDDGTVVMEKHRLLEE